MGVLGFLALVAALAFLVYTNPSMLRNILPGWLATSQPKPAILDDSKDSESTADGESTPKATPRDDGPDVPSFTLTGNDDLEKSDDELEAEPSVPSFPAPNSAQRAGAMPPPPRLKEHNKNPGLMLPPSRPLPSLKPSPAAALRVPSTGPLPDRGPPAGSQQRVSGGLSPNSTVKTTNTRGKVLLSPGHSPMDWAALTKKGNISGVNGFQRVTPSQLKQMTGRKGKPAWSIWQGKVYNITPYLPFHPGGEAELMKAAGRDGTKLFLDVHPWVNWENMLGTCLVGIMVPEDYASPLEEMD